MINYQPIDWGNEWKLFVYNFKVFWSGLRRPLLGQRINKDTYRFLVFFSFLLLQSSIIFFIPFTYFEILARGDSIYCIYIIHMIVRVFFQPLLLGRRLQDWGIPKSIVLLILSGCIWGTYEMGYTMTFDINHPFIDLSSTKETILDLPQYVDWMSCLVLVAIFIPDNKKFNRFGDFPKQGVIFFRWRFNEWKTVIYISPLKFIQSGLLFLKKSLNFSGRTSAEELGGFGGFIIAIQWFVSAMWYGGQYANTNTFVTVCEWLHIIFFIPSVSLFTRRLHDCYCSAFWIPFMYIPITNLFVYAVLIFGKSWKIEDFELNENTLVGNMKN